MREGETHNIRRAIAWGGIGLGMSVAAAAGVANHVNEHTTVGAHEGIIGLTHDGHATAKDIPIVGGDIRIPVHQALGTGINFKITRTPNIVSSIEADPLIISQPRGEAEKVGDIAKNLAIKSGLGGLALGTLTVGGVYARRRFGRTLAGETGTVLATAGSLLTIGLIAVPGTYIQQSHETWSSLDQQVPILKQINKPLVNQIEINESGLGSTAIGFINSGVVGYKDSINFYGPLRDRVSEVASQLHQPGPGEEVAVVISDRHDNINMDPVIRAVGDAVGATILIDAGDDFSASQEWESFSSDSLGNTFKHYKEKYVAPGNHDWAPFTHKAYKKEGITVLSGKPVNLGGKLKIIGNKDPRRSSFADMPETAGQESTTHLGQQLGAAACEAGNVSIAVVHSPTAARIVAESGCVRLVLAGHQHVMSGPEVIQGTNGNTTLFINGTSGGAGTPVPIALWHKLQANATMALVTLHEGEPVGIQSEVFTTSGQIEVSRYYPIGSNQISVEASKIHKNTTIANR